MSKTYQPEVYVAMRRGKLSNRRIAQLLGVNEATVRRGLKKWGWPINDDPRTVRVVLNELADLLDAR
jgi:transposase